MRGADDGGSTEFLQLFSSSGRSLAGKCVAWCGEVPPEESVPSMGAGDWAWFTPNLVAEVESRGGTAVVNPPKFLGNFFRTCSDIKVLSDLHPEEQKRYVRVETADGFREFPHSEGNFFLHKEFMGRNCEEANKVVTQAEELLNIYRDECMEREPVFSLISRASASYKFKTPEEERKFGYLAKRSISREELADILREYKPEHVKLLNITFDDKDSVVEGAENATAFINDLAKKQGVEPVLGKKRGAFVEDTILMKAVKAILSVDTCTANIPARMLGVQNYVFLAQEHNVRWHKLWALGAHLHIQSIAGDWEGPVCEALEALDK